MAALHIIVPSEKIEVDELCLLKLADGLIVSAAERFYKDRPLALPPIAATDSFMKLAEQHAIKHFGVVDRSKANIDTNSVFSRTFSFFWSPMSRVIYGPVTDSTKEETIPKESSTSSSI